MPTPRKSELLRVLVAGLASSYDPEHLSLVLVDYKGGSAFARCAELPHTVGFVTDLDDHLAGRALRSLEAELRRRERRLREAGVGSIEGYVEAGHDRSEPLPRLVVVIDEFATLAADLPTFVDALVSVAQRGRSLGVHLVLATQRPSGSVSPAVRANTAVRIALRVHDAPDSTDVIGTAAAAGIDRRRPGRGYARFGPGELIPFQAGLVDMPSAGSAPAVDVRPFRFGPEDVGGASPEAPDAGSGSVLDHLVETVIEMAREGNFRAVPAPWLPPLPESIELDRLPVVDGCALGLLDNPDLQAQDVYDWSPARGNVLLYGVGGSGARTAMMTVALSMAGCWSPSELHMYGLDFGPNLLAGIGALPHVGSIVGAGERERQERLLRFLRAELDGRRRAAPTPWRGGPRDEAKRPMLVLLIDNYGGFHAAFDDLAGLAWRDELARLVADGPALGVYVIATADRPGAVPLAIADLIPEKLLFRFADPGDVALFGLRPRTCAPLPAGRAVHVPTGQEVQMALAPTDAITTIVSGSTTPLSSWPRPIGVMPEVVAFADVAGASHIDGDDWFLALGIGDAGLAPAGLRLGDGETAVVAGPARSGKSTALVNIAGVVAASGLAVTVTVIAVRRSPLREIGAHRVVTDPAEVAAAIDRIGQRSGPHLVLIDDADGVDDPGGRLAALVREHRPDVRMVVAARADVLRTGYGHWTATVRRARSTIILQPQVDLDSELLQVALPRRPATFAPGRGYVSGDGHLELIQLAAPADTETGAR